ncbi:MAG: DUF4834 family protein [Bacteroidaceae bacterium]|nr:DUF4834 family protein [Bacteroidaceae bacterium]
MGIFGFLFIILPLILLFVVLGIGVTLVRSVLRFFGLGGGSSQAYGGYGSTSSSNGHRRDTQGRTSSFSSDSSSSVSRPKKVIGDDEGEYVEFEEVK